MTDAADPKCAHSRCEGQDGFPLLREAEWSFLPSLGRFGKAESHGADPNVTPSAPAAQICSLPACLQTLTAVSHRVQAETTGTASSREDQGTPKQHSRATPGGIPVVGATALQASVPLNPTSSACNWSCSKGGLAPRGRQVCNPPASCPCPGNTLLLKQLVLLLQEGTSPWLPGSLCSLLPSRPGLTAHLSPVSWQEVLLLSAGESEHWGKRLQDPRCTGRTIPGHSAPAAAIVRSKHQRRGRCGRAGDGPAESCWEHAYLHLPGEGRGGERGQLASRCAQFPSEQAGSSGKLPGVGHWGGCRVHSPALGSSLPSSASTSVTELSHHQFSSMTEKQLPGRRPELPADSLDRLRES